MRKHRVPTVRTPHAYRVFSYREGCLYRVAVTAERDGLQETLTATQVLPSDLTFLSLKLTFLSLKLTFLSLASHPCRTAHSPLSYSGNPGVNGVSHRGNWRRRLWRRPRRR